MSLLADMITKEFEGLMIEGENVLRNLQCDNVYDIDKMTTWQKKAEEFLTAWKTFPEEAKEECWRKPFWDIKASQGTYGDRIGKRIELVVETFNLATRPSTCIPSESSESMEAGDPIDKILEERGKVHGDSNASGEAFAKGIELLYEVGDKSDTITPYAFDGHMYAAMQCFIRLRHNPWHQDNYDDLLGYLRLAMKAISKEKRS